MKIKVITSYKPGTWEAYSRIGIESMAEQFPKEIDGWTSEELTITDDEYAILETRNAFIREYTNAAGNTQQS